jgi:ABC-2 type transport system permease protein
MTSLLRSELLKLRSTRTTIGLLLAAFALTLLVAFVHGYSTPEASLSLYDDQRTLFGAGEVSTLFATLVGIMAITSEFRHGTIRPSVLFEPRRERLMLAKLIAALGFGALFGLLAEALALTAGALVLLTRGIGCVFTVGDFAKVIGGIVAAALLWAGIGLGLGAIVRSQVGAIIGLFAWLFVVESLVFGLWPKVGRYLPGPAAQALAGGTGADLLHAAAGGLVLAAWLLAVVAAGTALIAQRDIP